MTALYSAAFPFGSLIEPIFKGYSDEHIANSHNCSTAYRYRLYQFILDSVILVIPFALAEIYCTGNI